MGSSKRLWLDHTKNGTPRGVPLNVDAIRVLDGQVGMHPIFCFTFQEEPIGLELTNPAWNTALDEAQMENFRCHDLRHTWASCRRNLEIRATS